MNRKYLRGLTLTLSLIVFVPFSAVQAASRYWATSYCGSGSWDSDCWNGASDANAPDGAGAPVAGDNALLYNHTATDYTVTNSGATPSLGRLHIAGYGSVQMKLSVTNGGSVSNAVGYLGDESGSAGIAVIDGVGSSWSNSSNVMVGRYGSGNLSITNGGTVYSGSGWVAYGHYVSSNPSSGTATVDGIGSSWVNNSALYVGNSGVGSMNVANGGSVTSEYGYVGMSTGGSGVVTIEGASSSWSNSSALTVGQYGAGTLNVTNGGSVSSIDGFLGFSGSFGGSSGTATIVGAGSNWTNSGSLYVGGNRTSMGGTGVLNIQNGGRVDVANEMKLYGAGTVNLTGGSLNADTIDTTTSGAQFNFTGGTLAVVTFNGDLVNRGGTLAPGSSPGLTTVNGNYSQDINSTLAIEIGGLIAGSEYDVLDVTGIAALAGILDVDLYDLGSGLFEPAEGDTFDIVTAESITGEFDFLSLVSLGNGLSWQVDYLVDAINTTDVVRLSVISAVPIPNAMWLFGSGLIGVTVFSRRGKHNSNWNA
jgi:T5SS/PEP-CTERM-associated repeat protein